MRVIVWHGWLLEGSGSNVATARVCEVLRASGHDVMLLCQEPHPERFDWIDAFGPVDAGGPGEMMQRRDASRAPGRCVVLRPVVGPTLPVFVVDRYEGFDDVKRFVDLTPDDTRHVPALNVDAVEGSGRLARQRGGDLRPCGPRWSDRPPRARTASRRREDPRQRPRVRRAAPGPVPGARARGARIGARRGGSGREVLERTAAFVPEVRDLARVVPPGVDVAAFRPRLRAEALLEAADRLERDPRPRAAVGPASIDADVARALSDRDRDALDALAGTYDQDVPDPDAATRLRNLAETDEPIVGYLGKLIPQKGVELVLAAHRAMRHPSSALIVGFGSHREWLAALDSRWPSDDAALEWLIEAGGMPIGRPEPLTAQREVRSSPAGSTIDTHRRRSRPWTCRSCPRPFQRRSAWWRPREPRPAP